MPRRPSLAELWDRQIAQARYNTLAPFAATQERVERFLQVQDIGKRQLRRPPEQTGTRRCEGFVLSTGKPCRAFAVPGSDFCVAHERYTARRESV